MKETEPDLGRLITAGRDTQIDWFSEQTPISNIATTMMAMANALGGTVLLGVAGPTGSVLGVRDADSALDRVIQAALSLDPPLIIPVPQSRTSTPVSRWSWRASRPECRTSIRKMAAT